MSLSARSVPARPSGMLLVAVARVLIECLFHVAVANAFKIKAFCVGDADTVAHSVAPQIDGKRA